ncbi:MULTISPECIES: hypothetical protein [Marinobacter]|jgi:protein SCO1|uniref:hypothetical protein n=1 Tax=Marinobacter TaxID=2742 RepID=UPI00294266F2|nr:hypothetical protein [Marinobacter salarius]WOI18604.1 hypothetical protein R1T46_17820 [Marinobacter salarius]
MRTRFWRQRTRIIPATLTLIAVLLLTGCLSNDAEDWNGKNISGLDPEFQDEVLTLFVSVDPKRDTPER